MKQVTKAQFDYFCRRVRFWLRKFGTTDWTVYYVFEEELTDCNAEIRYDYDGRSATFALPTMLDDTTRSSLDESALHEVVHLVIAPLQAVAERRYLSRDEIRGVNEGIACEITAALRTFLK